MPVQKKVWKLIEGTTYLATTPLFAFYSKPSWCRMLNQLFMHQNHCQTQRNTIIVYIGNYRKLYTKSEDFTHISMTVTSLPKKQNIMLKHSNTNNTSGWRTLILPTLITTRSGHQIYMPTRYKMNIWTISSSVNNHHTILLVRWMK